MKLLSTRGSFIARLRLGEEVRVARARRCHNSSLQGPSGARPRLTWGKVRVKPWKENTTQNTIPCGGRIHRSKDCTRVEGNRWEFVGCGLGRPSGSRRISGISDTGAGAPVMERTTKREGILTTGDACLCSELSRVPTRGRLTAAGMCIRDSQVSFETGKAPAATRQRRW